MLKGCVIASPSNVFVFPASADLQLPFSPKLRAQQAENISGKKYLSFQGKFSLNLGDVMPKQVHKASRTEQIL